VTFAVSAKVMLTLTVPARREKFDGLTITTVSFTHADASGARRKRRSATAIPLETLPTVTTDGHPSGAGF
jgi:hypothetical protein